MARNPGITAVAALALGLGIGANTAIFSVVNAVLLRPLPYKDPGRLVCVWEDLPSRNIFNAFSSYATFSEWRQQVQSFESTTGASPGSANLTDGAEPERVDLLQVNWTFFGLLGVRPVLGRDFLPEEDQPGARRVAMLDQGLWQRRFGSEKAILGRQIVLDNQGYTVVGVAPSKLQFAGWFPEAEVYVPIARSTARGAGHLSVAIYARLKPDVPVGRAQAELDGFYRQLGQRLPQLKNFNARVWNLHEFMVRDVRLSLLVLLGAVALVLLIACANVANVLLARAGARQREIAMRTALGAGRRRLLQQLLTESVLLALLGGVLGLALAWLGVRLFTALGPAQFPMLAQTRIDGQVLVFTLAVSLLTGILFGLAPAVAGTGGRVYDSLKEGGRGGESIRRNRFRSALVAAEVALALVLVAGASLLIRSLLRLQDTTPGFNPEGVLSANVTLPAAKYPNPEQRAAFFRQVLERVRAMPGVKSASMTNLLPLGGTDTGLGLIVEGQPPPRPGEIPIFFQRVTDPGYLQVMQIPLRRGRYFSERDTGRPPVAIINETMARRFWPDQDPVGRRFGDGRNWLTIVGVAGDVKHMSLVREPPPAFYEPFLQTPRPGMTLVVRTSTDPLRMAPALRRAVLESDKDQPVSKVASMTQMVSNSIASRRFSVVLLGIFAGVALALAAVGIYGVISFSVTRRTQEIGVRMALGAQRGDVLRMVVGQALALAGAGIAAGLAGGLALTRFIRSLLFQVSATDPATLAGVCVLVIAVAALASYIPARRAARVDPVIALRYE